MSLVFYTNPMSRGRIVRWMLEEIGAPYETKFLRYGEEMNHPEYLAINPMGKVPTIVHDGAIVTECAAICAYLADAFPDAGLAPTPAERANYYRWLFFAAGPLESATSNNSMGWNTDAKQRMTIGYGTFERTRETLIKAVSDKRFVCGERFTAADVYVGAHVTWGLQFNSIPTSPELEAYRDRVQARPALARAWEIDNAAMADYGQNPQDA